MAQRNNKNQIKKLIGGIMFFDYKFRPNPITGKYEFFVYDDNIIRSVKTFDTKKELKDWIRMMNNLKDIELGRQPTSTWNEMLNSGNRNTNMENVARHIEEFGELTPRNDRGMGKPIKSDLHLHAVIFHKPYSLKQAQQEAQKIMKSKTKHYYRETPKSYRFRAIPKTKFIPKSYKTKIINSSISLIFGKLK